MKKYKFFASILAAVTVVGFISCDSLDVAPESSITDANYWSSADQFNSFYSGVHSQLRGLSANFFYLGEPRADFYTGETSWGGESATTTLPLNDLKPTSAGISNYAGAYSVINQINLLISNSESTSLLTVDQQAKYLGASYGMRAFIYFHLLRSWGDVIVKTDATKELDVSNLDRAQDDASVVMAQIKSDIDMSERYFALAPQKDCTYWNLGATKMLKGEVLLWDGKYEEALAALKDVNSSNQYGLVADFSGVFDYHNKKNKEIIFAFPTQIVSDNNEYALLGGQIRENFTPQHQYMGSYYSNPECTKGINSLVLTTTVNGTDYSYPVSELNGVNHYDFFKEMYTDENIFRDGDLRKDATFVPVYGKDKDEKPYYAGIFQHKFNGVMQSGKSERTWADDYPVYRYADCLLLQAFAKAKLGKSPKEEIDEVRKRAYGANWDESKYGYGNDNKQSTYVDADNVGAVEAVLKERCREFILEGKRWYDLRLAGDSYVYKHSRAQQGRILWPIDTGTLTNNPGLHQTPGYSN